MTTVSRNQLVVIGLLEDDQCHARHQVIIGSYPHGDGTFDKANDFQSVVVDGAWSMALATAKLHAGQVAYIVPAAKGECI